MKAGASSDTAFGFMNTPAYFTMDNFTTGDTAYAQPTATDDEITTTYLNDTLIAVLANDANLIANPFTVSLIGTPLIPGATDTIINNEIYYVPAIGIVATETLTYKVCDDLGACDTAQVIIHVTVINSVGDITAEEIKIYPNPFKDEFTVYSLQFTVEQIGRASCRERV